jgi:hypothetical protein
MYYSNNYCQNVIYRYINFNHGIAHKHCQLGNITSNGVQDLTVLFDYAVLRLLDNLRKHCNSYFIGLNRQLCMYDIVALLKRLSINLARSMN